MKQYLTIFSLVFFIMLSCTAQEKDKKEEDIQLSSNFTTQDSLVFYNLPQEKLPLSSWGKLFLGTPYVPATLEVGDDVEMVLNLTELDCTTFVENALALHLVDTVLPHSFEQKLKEIRYREGKAEGYLSRLHYFSEWIADNQAKGLLEDITSKIGGVVTQGQIDFMSTHIQSYPVLVAQPHLVDSLKKIEQRLSKSVRHIIPKNQVKLQEKYIEDGDIIAIATSIKGLDFVHVGIAVRDAETHRIHLLHASSSLKKVVVTEVPLSDFLARNKVHTGIAVLRVNN